MAHFSAKKRKSTASGERRWAKSIETLFQKLLDRLISGGHLKRDLAAALGMTAPQFSRMLAYFRGDDVPNHPRITTELLGKLVEIYGGDVRILVDIPQGRKTRKLGVKI